MSTFRSHRCAKFRHVAATLCVQRCDQLSRTLRPAAILQPLRRARGSAHGGCLQRRLAICGRRIWSMCSACISRLRPCSGAPSASCSGWSPATMCFGEWPDGHRRTRSWPWAATSGSNCSITFPARERAISSSVSRRARRAHHRGGERRVAHRELAHMDHDPARLRGDRAASSCSARSTGI